MNLVLFITCEMLVLMHQDGFAVRQECRRHSHPISKKAQAHLAVDILDPQRETERQSQHQEPLAPDGAHYRSR